MTQYPGRCPHGLNSAACLACYHAPKAPVPRAQPAAPQNGAPLPGRADGRHAAPGDRTGACIGQPGSGIVVSDEERARFRKIAPAAPPALSAPEGARPPPVREAYSSAREDGSAYSADKLWEPPVRPEVIDRLPRHPEAGKVR